MKIQNVTSTSVPEQTDEKQFAEWPSLPTQTDNFRKAFAVVGVLIAGGHIAVDFDNRNWANTFESMVLDVAQVLDTTAT